MSMPNDEPPFVGLISDPGPSPGSMCDRTGGIANEVLPVAIATLCSRSCQQVRQDRSHSQ